MDSIQHPTALDGAKCPVCPELVTLRRELSPRTFAMRYWVVCPAHGCLSDLATWLDRDMLAPVTVPVQQPPATAA